jgi:hypothetical protein
LIARGLPQGEEKHWKEQSDRLGQIVMNFHLRSPQKEEVVLVLEEFHPETTEGLVLAWVHSVQTCQMEANLKL